MGIRTFAPVIELSLLLLLNACMVGPAYNRPEVALPVSWELSSEQVAAIANPRWWEQFGDPELNRLVALALEENRDIRKAVAAVEEYMALLGVEKSASYPQITASASAIRQKAQQSGDPLVPANPYSSNFNVTLNLSYELDLWGRISRAEEAAKADLLAREEARRVVVLSIASQVATAYVQLLELDKRMVVTLEAMKAREEAFRLAEIRFAGGIISELDVQQSAVELATARALVPDLGRQAQLKEHQISVLTGRNPEPVRRGRNFDALTSPLLPAAMPSDLLKRRPDVMQAEQNLIAANARIGKEMAGYFPKLSLTAMLGESTDRLLPFNWETTLLQGVISAAGPVFNGFLTKRLVETADSREQQARAAYEQTVLTSFREVYDALVSRRSYDLQSAAQSGQVEALKKVLKLATLRYVNGYTSYIDVLDARRSLLYAELELIQSRSAVHLQIIELYRALGGGWEVADGKPVPPTPKL